MAAAAAQIAPLQKGNKAHSGAVERAKALEKMSEEERKFWLELHKGELEEEQKEALEKKMLDKSSQAELKELVEKIKKEKVEKAEGALKKAEELTKAETEAEKFNRSEEGKRQAEVRKNLMDGEKK
jgi:hypothetical protein